jgi:hypothetical protein
MYPTGRARSTGSGQNNAEWSATVYVALGVSMSAACVDVTTPSGAHTHDRIRQSNSEAGSLVSPNHWVQNRNVCAWCWAVY